MARLGMKQILLLKQNSSLIEKFFSVRVRFKRYTLWLNLRLLYIRCRYSHFIFLNFTQMHWTHMPNFQKKCRLPHRHSNRNRFNNILQFYIFSYSHKIVLIDFKLHYVYSFLRFTCIRSSSISIRQYGGTYAILKNGYHHPNWIMRKHKIAFSFIPRKFSTAMMAFPYNVICILTISSHISVRHGGYFLCVHETC